mgnify:CR=1
MLSTSNKKIRYEHFYFQNEKETFKFAKILKWKTFAKQFNLFKNWNLLRNFVINIYKSTSYCFHLLDQELF